MLLWTTLFSATAWLYIRMYEVFFRKIQYTPHHHGYSLVPLIPLFASAPLAGWLADMKLGNYRVFRIGSILLFLDSILGCLCVLISENVGELNGLARIFSGAVAPTIVYILASVGGLSCLVTALQLGLDQMPDASAANISSFIAWFVFSVFLGLWFAEAVFFIPSFCTRNIVALQDLNMLLNSDKTLAQLTILVPVLCTAVICSSLFICAPKWLIIEPKSPQSLKIIYQVLKFAAKHKAPINRSAFTYWEEDIPSRIDLGKSKYGGPFTTEQVEDVKTVLKILVVLLSFAFVLIALGSSVLVYILPPSSTIRNCTSALLYSLTYSPWWSIIIANMAYEFGVYPIVRNRLPNVLKRIGITVLLFLILNSAYFIFNMTDFFYPEMRILQQPQWPHIVYSILNGIVTLFFLSGVVEFVCAQAPYNMRGLLTGYISFIIAIPMSFGLLIFYIFKLKCTMPSCTVIHASISMFLSLVGFILYCVLARWYKMRVRDEDYSPHRVIEEVYDRYLSQVR